jgi:proteasome lid subunit RPN8/RPN11
VRGKRTGADQVRIILRQEAQTQVERHCESDTRSEIGGVLLGSAYRHEGDTFVEVNAALPAQSNDHGPNHFTFNADVWSQIHRDRATEYPELDIVGWFHTHPGLGAFFSGDDVIVHTAAFVLPWHVSLVIDPLRREAATFAWEKGAIRPLPGFYQLPGEEESLKWRIIRGPVWSETFEERLAQGRTAPGGRAANDTHERGDDGLPAVDPWLGVLIGILGVLLSLGMLFGGLIPLGRQNAALSGVVRALADERLSQAAGAACPDPRLRIMAPLPGQAVPNSTSLTVVGTADHPEAWRYRLAMRPEGQVTWWQLHTFRRDVSTGLLQQLDGGEVGNGSYELQLAALDRAGTPLSEVAPCHVNFSIVDSPPNPD